MNGPSSIQIPDTASTASYTATVKDQNGGHVGGQTVTWSLLAPVTGVSIDSSSGVVTVDSTATPGSFTVVATDGTMTGTEGVGLDSPQ